MSASTGELYDACAGASLLGPRWRHSRPVLWLTEPAIRVGERSWRARKARQADDGETVFGFDARQCAQVAEALRPVMAAHRDLLERYAAGAAGISQGDPAVAQADVTLPQGLALLVSHVPFRQ